MTTHPTAPKKSAWKTFIKRNIAKAPLYDHVTAIATGVILNLEYCVEPDGTPIWDSGTLNSDAKIVAIRGDGVQKIIQIDNFTSWDSIAECLDVFMTDWEEKAAQAVDRLVARAMQIADLNDQIDQLEREEKLDVKAAYRLGVSKYRIAKSTGRAETTINTWIS